ncbi:GNAT family N-acetyltransferase [bacterium]|nr:GNAT family N-acetyltransferase [bacterium]
MKSSDHRHIADSMAWRCCHFPDLTATEVYQLAKLRIDVFVVEQACPYPELDDLDLLDDTLHLFASLPSQPAAYARILAPRPHAPEPLPLRIGRVVVTRNNRRQGLASALMKRVLTKCESEFAGHDPLLAAQVEVRDFYASLGFTDCSEPYLDYGIEHIDMRRPASGAVFDSAS